MTFCEKIRKILKHNNLKITSASKLEEYAEVGRSSITAHYTKEGKPCAETAPGLMVQTAIQEKLRINKEWWETGKGEIFMSSAQAAEALVNKAFQNEAITWELWQQLKTNNEKFSQQIDRLWNQIEEKDRLINRLAPDKRVEGVPTKN